MPNTLKPYYLEIESFGSGERGFLTAMSGQEIPFVPQRIFWIYGTPAPCERGLHAHQKSVIFIVAMHGKAEIICESVGGQTFSFLLENPQKAVIIPPLHWHKIQIEQPETVLFCMASEPYNEAAYIRDYETFKSLHG